MYFLAESIQSNTGELTLHGDFVVGCATAFVALIAVLATYRSTKKIKFFEALFNKKAESYEHFIELTDDYTRTEFDIVRLTNAIKTCTLYASPKVENVLTDYLLALQEINIENDIMNGSVKADTILHLVECRQRATSAMREDIRRCRRYRFD